MKQKPRRSFRRLTIHERSVIEVEYCTHQKSLREIAQGVGCAHTTVLREIRGKPREGMGRYGAVFAQKKSVARVQRCGRKKVLDQEPLMEYVKEKLVLGWSPEQISIRLPLDTGMRVSHETIYTYIYDQVHRGGNGTVKPGKEDLRSYLCHRRKRRMRKGSRKTRKLQHQESLPSIERRPAIVKKRTETGHWEGDTVVSRKSAVRVKTVNELVTGLVLFAKTTNGTAQACNDVLIQRMQEIPLAYRKTLTQDRGSENYDFARVEKNLKITCYFAHPYCSHERGANENTNGLLRRYFPKGTDFANVKDSDLRRVENLLNNRPRKRLGGLTPREVYYHTTGGAIKV